MTPVDRVFHIAGTALLARAVLRQSLRWGWFHEREGTNGQAVMDPKHGLVEDFRGQSTPGDTGEGRVVVISHPDAGHVVAGEADKPSIARRLRRPGLARGGSALQLGAGDGFFAGLLKGWMADEPWESSLRYANACGALAVSRLVALLAETPDQYGLGFSSFVTDRVCFSRFVRGILRDYASSLGALRSCLSSNLWRYGNGYH